MVTSFLGRFNYSASNSISLHKTRQNVSKCCLHGIMITLQKEAEKEPSTLINPTKKVSGRGIMSLELHSTVCPSNNFFSYNLLNDLEN